MEESIVECQYDDGETAMAGRERNGGFGIFGYGRKQPCVRKLETESVGPEFELSTRIMKVGTGQASQ